MRIPSWALFRSVSNRLSTCQFPSVGNDRDANTIAKLLIPNMLLIRQAALLEVVGRKRRPWQWEYASLCCLSRTHGFAVNEECPAFLKMTPRLINLELPHSSRAIDGSLEFERWGR